MSMIEHMGIDLIEDENVRVINDSPLQELTETIDLYTYINNYKDFGKYLRLIFIARRCRPLRLEALIIALEWSKQSCNYVEYCKVFNIIGTVVRDNIEMADATLTCLIPGVCYRDDFNFQLFQRVSYETIRLPDGRLLEFDSEWVDETRRESNQTIDQLHRNLKNYKAKNMTESIRRGCDDLAFEHMKTGDLLSANKIFTRSRDYCKTDMHELMMCFDVIKVSIYLSDWRRVSSYVDRAYTLFENIINENSVSQNRSSTTNSTTSTSNDEGISSWKQSLVEKVTAAQMGSRQKMKAFLHCVVGLVEMYNWNFAAAAQAFLQVDHDYVSFNNILTANDVALYATVCSLATFDRNTLKAMVTQNSNFKMFLENDPTLRDILNNFLNFQYAECLNGMALIKNQLLLDIYLADHVKYLYREIRNRTMCQQMQASQLSSDAQGMAGHRVNLATALPSSHQSDGVAGLFAGHRPMAAAVAVGHITPDRNATMAANSNASPTFPFRTPRFSHPNIDSVVAAAGMHRPSGPHTGMSLAAPSHSMRGAPLPLSMSKSNVNSSDENMLTNQELSNEIQIISQEVAAKPVKVQSANAKITPIRLIEPSQNNWTIEGRVSQKHQMSTFSNPNGSGKLFGFIVCDSTCDIKIVAFNNQASKFFNSIQVGKIYSISKGVVKSANAQFNKTQCEYEISLTQESEIVEVQDNPLIPQMLFKFVPINEIETQQLGTVIDVVGVAHTIMETVSIIQKTSNRELLKRELQLIDRSRMSVRLTLWGDNVHIVNDLEHPVIVIKGAMVKDFNGRNLSCDKFSTLLVNPEQVEEAMSLLAWYTEGKHEDTTFQSLSATGSGAMQLDAPVSTLLSLSSDPNSDRGDYFTTKATVTHIKREGCVYKGCMRCNKKLFDLENGTYKCEKCSTIGPDYSYRILLNVQLSDYTGDRWVTCFQNSAENILGRSAQEIGDIFELERKKELESIFKGALMQELRFKLRVKHETYNDETRMKVVVVDCRSLDLPGDILTNMRHLLEI